ncbi:Ribokinase-like protein [Melanogaster broomeanus]|nr:Ribokinase-like protein [Melanogaster broomeanus]
MGYDVDVVNTVNFSNHSGYGHFGGTKTSAEELTRIFNLMQQTDVLIPDRLLTGYIPNAESLDSVHKLVKTLKTTKADLLYVLDPVLGDSGKLYVAENCVPLYRQMLPLATIITPNWFEVEVLTEIPLTDLTSLRAALHKLHKTYQVPNVVISSIPLSKLSTSLPSDLLPTSSMRPASSINGTNKPMGEEPTSLQTPANRSVLLLTILNGFKIVWPIFSKSLAYATSHALCKTHAILTLTHHSASTLSLPSSDDELDAREPGRKSRRMKGRELRIIQGQEIFRREAWDGVEKMGVWEGFWKD